MMDRRGSTTICVKTNEKIFVLVKGKYGLGRRMWIPSCVNDVLGIRRRRTVTVRHFGSR